MSFDVQKRNSFVYHIFVANCFVFPNKSCRICSVQLKSGILYQMNDNFCYTLFLNICNLFFQVTNKRQVNSLDNQISCGLRKVWNSIADQRKILQLTMIFKSTVLRMKEICYCREIHDNFEESDRICILVN